MDVDGILCVIFVECLMKFGCNVEVVVIYCELFGEDDCVDSVFRGFVGVF